jgi:hypothetical protein
MFDELLKFSKTHSQTVIAALVGVVVVGGIGGRLLIQSLEETISEQKSSSFGYCRPFKRIGRRSSAGVYAH